MSDIRDFQEDRVTEKEFQEQYSRIKEMLLYGNIAKEEKCAILLGGQPGSGKSSLFARMPDQDKYVVINGDDFRQYHPRFKEIVKTDLEHYAERTAAFSARVSETLIEDLSAQGYNMIIEGTLRDPEVPIKTCTDLKERGYSAELLVMACDAEKAWESTLTRADELIKAKQVGRLVPIDVYNYTVNHLPENLETIDAAGCFDRITIVNREHEVLYPNRENIPLRDVLEKELSLSAWNKNLENHEKDFLERKVAILQKQINEREKSTRDRAD